MAEDYGGARDATPSGAVTPPAPGQLARVLGRMWAVEEVARDSQASLDARPVQNHVSLVSVEDDAAGEVLEVIGEVEPGKRVIERAELPVILSIDWLKGELGMRLWREVLPGHPAIPRRYDVLIVDEVHNSRRPARADGMRGIRLRTAAIRTLAPPRRAPAVPVRAAAQRL